MLPFEDQRESKRAKRRLKRKTEFNLEFSLSSLDLSSIHASQAVSELKNHADTITKTAELTYEDAVSVHKKEILQHHEKLHQLDMELLVKGGEPTRHHLTMVHLAKTAILSHEKILEHRKDLQDPESDVLIYPESDIESIKQ